MSMSALADGSARALGGSQVDARRRAGHLREQIRGHDYRYYVLDRPTVTDASYDALVRELRNIEAAFPRLITSDSPTQRVAGGVRRDFDIVVHHAPMLSLESTAAADDVRQFDARMRAIGGDGVRYVLEPKFDGVSVELVYRDGALACASTRGTGRRGEDVTANVRTIRSVPLHLRGDVVPVPQMVAVRGEVMMRRAEFASLNRELTRNGQPQVANPRNAAAGSLRQLDPSVTAERQLDICFYDVLAIAGAPAATRASDYCAWMRAWGLRTSTLARSGSTADDILAYCTRLAHARGSLDIGIDGVVAKIDSLALRRRLGNTTRHPRWAIACAFAPRSAERRTNIVSGPAQRARAIGRAASSAAFDIKGLGPGTVTALVRARLVRTAADLFALTDEDLRGLPRFGPVAATRLAGSIRKAKRVTLDRFLVALDIPSVGAAAAAELAAEFRTLAAVRTAPAAQLGTLPGIGSSKGREIAAFFRRASTQALIDALLRHGVSIVGSR